MISMIAAIGKNRELGLNGDLCFHLKEDMKWFKEKTMGHAILMGRKTWESLPKRPLPGRVNIVVTRDNLGADDCPDRVIHDLQAFVAEPHEEEIFVIGGGMLYWEMMKYADKLYLTEIETEAEADTFFPEVKSDEWMREVLKEGEEDGVKFVFAVYTRK